MTWGDGPADARELIFRAKIEQARREQEEIFRRCFIAEFGQAVYDRLKREAEIEPYRKLEEEHEQASQ